VSYFLYILRSQTGERYYVGSSSDPTRRLEFHNSTERGFTARYRPWRIVYTAAFETREEARRAERRVKAWKSRRMIEELIAGARDLDP
jgi:putative endonuclease